MWTATVTDVQAAVKSFELRDVELLPQLFASADLLSTGVATSCALLGRQCVGCGAVLEQARVFNAFRLTAESERFSEPDFMLVGVLWTML